MILIINMHHDRNANAKSIKVEIYHYKRRIQQHLRNDALLDNGYAW